MTKNPKNKIIVIFTIFILINITIMSGLSEEIISKKIKNKKIESENFSWLTLIYPNGGELCSDMILIRWEWGGPIPILPVFFNLYYKDDSIKANEEWQIIAIDHKKGDYNWDTNLVCDGYYMIKIELVLDSDLDGHGDMIWIWDTSDDYFTIENNNDPPYIPSNPIPEDGSTNINITTNLSWECGDPDPCDIVTYNIFLGTNPGSLECIISAYNKETYHPDLIYNTQYYWKIDAYDGLDVTEGDIWTFKTTINQPPNIPCNPYPPNESININFTITINWTGGDPNNEPVLYDLYLGENPNPLILISNISKTEHTIENLKRNTQYYWKINSKDGTYLTEGPIWNFKTAISLPPNTPKAPSGPTEGRTGKKYTYQTNTTDPENNLLYYWFDWCDNTNSGWLGPYESEEIAKANHTWTQKETYWIRVKAINDPNGDGDLSDGSVSKWSTYSMLTITKEKSIDINPILIRFLNQYQNLFPILKLLTYKFLDQ